jgi:hypothetical protein
MSFSNRKYRGMKGLSRLFEWGEECIPIMFDLRLLMASPNDRDDIEANLPFMLNLSHVDLGRIRYQAHLFAGNKNARWPVSSTSTGFHFNKNQDIPFPGDEVDFCPGEPPVRFQDVKPLLAQKIGRGRLAAFTGL